MNEAIKILMLEDVATDVELACRELRRAGLVIDVRHVETRGRFVDEMAVFKPHIILSDFSLPSFDGISALAIACETQPDIPFIFLSGAMGEETAISAMKCGAVDYVLKSNLLRLPSAVQRALNESQSLVAKTRAESRFRDLIEFAPHAIVVLNENGVIEIVNTQAEILFGCTRKELLGAPGDRLIPGGFPQWAESDGQHGNKVRACVFEMSAHTYAGTVFPAEVSLSPLKTEGRLWISSVIRDISERKEQEQRLIRLTRIRTIVSNINALILRIRDKQRLLQEACRIIFDEGKFAGVAIGMLDTTTSLVTPVAWAGMDEMFVNALPVSADETLPEGRGSIGVALRTQQAAVSDNILGDPRTVPWHALFRARGFCSTFAVPLLVAGKSIGILILFGDRIGAFNDEEQHLLKELAGDISFALDYLDKQEQINYLAYFDSLTGLPNRTLFRDRLGLLLAMESQSQVQDKIVVVLVDLERFRNVNDTLGRAAGDELLREVARRLRDSVAEPSYLARISADCFGFVVKESRSDVDVVDAIEHALLTWLAGSIQLMGKDIRVSVRAGLSIFKVDGMDADTLLRNAEVALKQAKLANVRSLFYKSKMNARTAEKLSIESRLRNAVEQQQFQLYYQPKVDVASGKIAGLEALIRWNEPGVGMVMPGTFIHVLEETGLIVEVGSWVIAEAHWQYQQWLKSGLNPPRIAVNVSQLQIRRKDFVSTIAQLLDTPEPTQLEIEITESLFMEGVDQHVAKRKLAALREIGISVAIDDFGTGYSSLSYIARLPIDTLKIDRSFIMNMEDSADNMAIVSTIVSLAHSLKLNVVAEGVETQRQFDLLAELKCDQIQGYLYCRPLPADEIEQKLLSQVARAHVTLSDTQ